MMQSTYDVAILGGGAAGLMAAIAAAQRGRSVVVLEKNRRPGVKILMSGGTRCNLTNARGLHDLSLVSGSIDPAFDPTQARGARAIQEAFGANGAFLGPALRALGVADTIRFFESEGIATKIEANGKIFPVSDRAVDVLNALVAAVEGTGASICVNTPANRVEWIEESEKPHFLIRAPGGDLRAGAVVVACGGQSYPGCGTIGDGYAIARAFEHTIIPPKPALVPLRVDLPWVQGLSGLTLRDAEARVIEGGIMVDRRREAVLFAHFGLTGPAILDVSRSFGRSDQPGELVLELDLEPNLAADRLDHALQVASRTGRKGIASLVPESIPRRLAEELVLHAEIASDRLGPDLTKSERARLVATIKALRLPNSGTLGFAKAEVTSGGVSLDEIDPRTMQSLRRRGLYFCGEVLDLDGRIGGYNFQAAWSTGRLAGGSV